MTDIATPELGRWKKKTIQQDIANTKKNTGELQYLAIYLQLTPQEAEAIIKTNCIIALSMQGLKYEPIDIC